MAAFHMQVRASGHLQTGSATSEAATRRENELRGGWCCLMQAQASQHTPTPAGELGSALAQAITYTGCGTC
jgi:hypothetical protein